MQTTRKFLVPETIQVSALDCGPAALRSLLAGHGIPASYGRLREACQTSVDGTSIDALEEVANVLGLHAEQVIVPRDHVLLDSACALPSIAAALTPLDTLHFLVLWRKHGRFVQLMDPAVGRRWVPRESLLPDLYQHTMPVAAADWRAWAGGDEFLSPLEERLSHLKVSVSQRAKILAAATEDESWRSLAALDAAVRQVTTLTRAGAVHAGAEAARLLERLSSDAVSKTNERVIPESYWSVRSYEPDDDGQSRLMLAGVVVVRAQGLRNATASSTSTETEPHSDSPHEIQAALTEDRARPERAILELTRAEGVFRPSLVMCALFTAATVTFLEALLFRVLIDVGQEVGLVRQRLHVLSGVLLFLTGAALLELPIVAAALGFGRRLEVRLRRAFLSKLPHLADRYFRSRLVSDMAARSHAIHAVRMVPNLAFTFLRGVFGLLLVTAGIAWLDPRSAGFALAAAFAAVAVPIAASPFLLERTLRAQTHNGALTRFYLDALLGLIAIRAHSAEATMRREHESRLVDWAHAGLSAQRAAVIAESVQLMTGLGLAAALILGHTRGMTEPGAVLLLVYWALALPEHGAQIALALRQYPYFRNTMLRFTEVLDAPEHVHSDATTESEQREESPRGVAIDLENMSVVISGQAILTDVTTRIAAGTHIAVVGPSGAGKTSLVSVLLGWHEITEGKICIDNQELDPLTLERLRARTVWIDPTVQLWNRSLLDNVQYGADEHAHPALDDVLRRASLQNVLPRLDKGLQTKLGEGGGLLSGGEGQRVRLARALMRPEASLVILDEPFRGLERSARRTLMKRVRDYWPHATVVCITHDIAEVLDFDHVLVIEDGRLVEQGAAQVLRERHDSRFGRMLAADVALQREVWSGEPWRHVRMQSGRLDEAHNDDHRLDEERFRQAS